MNDIISSALNASIDASHRDALRERSRREEHERQDLLRRDLRDKYIASAVPDSVADRLFEYAWMEGHANGNHEVERIYEDLKDVVNAAFRAGREFAASRARA